MGRVAKVILGTLLSVGCLAFVQLHEASSKTDRGVSVKRQIEPRYPIWAYQHGVSSGFAKVAFYVGEDGEISELMPIEYSYEVFVDELMAVVPKWKFRPARQNGRAVKSVCHVYWEFLPDRPIETNALFDTARRMESSPNEEYRELKYRTDAELDDRIGMIAFPGLVLETGDPDIEADLDFVRARVSFFVTATGEVSLPQVIDSTHPQLDLRLEDAIKNATFAVPSYRGQAVLALVERTYDFPVVWSELGRVRE